MLASASAIENADANDFNEQSLIMSIHLIANIGGIACQVLGAGYLVYQSYFTSRSLLKYKPAITYDNLGPAIEQLAHEVQAQFKHQALGFLLVVIGAALQVYAATASM